jgi:tetratricopeptide (TPR) repeat protein
MHDVADALHVALTEQDVRGLSNRQVTSIYSATILNVLKASNLGEVVRELRTSAKLQPESGALPRHGIVDFAVKRDGHVVLAVELDGSDKSFSVTKLQYFAALGARCIWIRWGRSPRIAVPSEIEVITPEEASVHRHRTYMDVELSVFLHAPALPVYSHQGVAEPRQTYTVSACRSEVRDKKVAIISAAAETVLVFHSHDVSHISFAQPATEAPRTTQPATPSSPTWDHSSGKRRAPSQVVATGAAPERAYQYWSAEEDAALISAWKTGASVAELSEQHLRDRGAIRSRLKKLDPTGSDTTQDASASEGTPTAMADDQTSNRLKSLREHLDRSWSAGDWQEAREAAQSALTLATRTRLDEANIEYFGIAYLGALIGDGAVLRSPDSTEHGDFAKAVAEFATWVARTGHVRTVLAGPARSMTELVKLSRETGVAAEGQIASQLRRVRRPDVAVMVCDRILAQSRLNYYALATRGAALSDLGDLDAAIISIRQALGRFRPTAGAERALNALARALRLRYLRDGDIEDAELALVAATAALILVPDDYSINTVVATAGIQMDPSAAKAAQDLIAKYGHSQRSVNEEKARQVLGEAVGRLTQ